MIRQALGSVARRMKQTLVRTAFSPVIYEVLDFAAAMYDDRVRLLAEAPSLPIFMGTMSFCVEEAVAGVGGPDVLRDGDVILYNSPYGTGSHAQDCAVVMPVFLGGKEIVGYAAIKGHLLDIGGKDPYSTDTVDVFQEGTIFPGVWLYRGGELVRDVYRMLLANTRVPDMVAGDISAEVAGVRAGASALVALIERFGLDVFRDCVERMYDHGESLVRECLERIPDGRYVGRGRMDNNGVDDDEIPFEVTVEVKGSDVTVDFSAAPDTQTGPMNCPIASTVSGARIAIAMLAGGADDSPNEGHFRPLEVIARRAEYSIGILFADSDNEACSPVNEAIARGMVPSKMHTAAAARGRAGAACSLGAGGLPGAGPASAWAAAPCSVAFGGGGSARSSLWPSPARPGPSVAGWATGGGRPVAGGLAGARRRVPVGGGLWGGGLGLGRTVVGRWGRWCGV